MKLKPNCFPPLYNYAIENNFVQNRHTIKTKLKTKIKMYLKANISKITYFKSKSKLR